MNNAMRQIGNISLFIGIVSVFTCYSCSTDITGARCETDQQCPSGQYCGEDKRCHKGTKPLRDTGTNKDAGTNRDVGMDTTYGEIEDIREDISLEDTFEDTFIEDVDLDGGYEDTPSDVESDGGFSDVLEDTAGDTGNDISINVRIPSLYDMSAGSVRSGEYEIRTVTGNSARPTIEINGVKSYITKNK